VNSTQKGLDYFDKRSVNFEMSCYTQIDQKTNSFAMPKNQTFSHSCAQNRLAKIVGEVNGTKCGELCCYKHLALGFLP
jgi:hypothetical protein